MTEKFSIAFLLVVISMGVRLGDTSVVFAQGAGAKGEPVEAFAERLKSAGYFDTAIAYLNRVKKMPGVSAAVKSTVPLELANVYVDSAVAARTAVARDQAFVAAESQLKEFVKQASHPRYSEARTMLAKLQLLRASQLMSGELTPENRQAARASFNEATKSFDAIIADLKTKLEAMQGQKVNAATEPEKAKLRDQYYSQYLESKVNAAEAIKLAGMTFDDPKAKGKDLLAGAMKRYEEIFDKYSQYPIGAMAMSHIGEIRRTLGDEAGASDAYLRMLEQPEIPDLRNGKITAANGLALIWLAKSPPNYKSAIERGQSVVDGMLPNERNLDIMQSLRLNLGRAYLLKTEDKENNNVVERKRAKSAARNLLREASKVAGDHLDETQKLLATLGFDTAEQAEEIVADPATFQEGFESMQILLREVSTLESSLAVLKDGDKASDDVRKIEDQVIEAQSKAIAIIRRSLRLITSETDVNSVNQARQVLAYMLLEQDRYRESAVVGSFLAKRSPGNRTGLDGGLMALGAFQKLAGTVSGDQLAAVSTQIRNLGGYLTKTWPDEPRAAVAQGIMIRLALQADQFDEAKRLIEEMPDGEQKSSFYRLMGQLTWNRSIQATIDKNNDLAKELWTDAADQLTKGMSNIPGDVAPAEAVQAALILARVHLRLGQPAKALAVLDNKQYGPVKTMGKVQIGSERFPGDMYSAELQAAIGKVTTDGDPDKKLTQRALDAMKKLIDSASGANSQQKLMRIFLGMSQDIRDRIDNAAPQEKESLIETFREFLDQMSTTTEDPATLQWAGQQLMQFGEALLGPDQQTATGKAKSLIDSSVRIFERQLAKTDNAPLSLKYQLARAKRLSGKYSDSLNLLEEILKEKPTMLDAQVEAALAYQQLADSVAKANKSSVAVKIYRAAMVGGRKNAAGQNTIWGWGRISTLTQRDPNRQAEFFDARYHIAQCRLKQGLAANDLAIKKQAVSDITTMVDRFPELGGPEQRSKFDTLLKLAQKAAGMPARGLPPLPVAAN